MRSDPAKLIQSWFAKHEGDGEFTSGMRAAPYSVIGPMGAAGRVIFTTKPSSVSAIIHQSKAPKSLGMIGRYGLPDEADLVWIRKVIGRRALLFLGDMDPADLLIYAWLSASLRPMRVIHLGVNDALLDALQIRSTSSLSMRCSPSERKSLGFLKKVMPEFRDVVGERCASMLEQGDKLELEAAVSSSLRKAATTWRSLLSCAHSRKRRPAD